MLNFQLGALQEWKRHVDTEGNLPGGKHDHLRSVAFHFKW